MSSIQPGYTKLCLQTVERIDIIHLTYLRHLLLNDMTCALLALVSLHFLRREFQ